MADAPAADEAPARELLTPAPYLAGRAAEAAAMSFGGRPGWLWRHDWLTGLERADDADDDPAARACAYVGLARFVAQNPGVGADVLYVFAAINGLHGDDKDGFADLPFWRRAAFETFRAVARTTQALIEEEEARAILASDPRPVPTPVPEEKSLYRRRKGRRAPSALGRAVIAAEG